MPQSFPLAASARIDTQAFVHNMKLLAGLVPWAEMLPMMKANAYGHGVLELAGLVERTVPKLYGIGVATLEEAIALRACVGSEIIVFSSPFQYDQIPVYKKYRLTPVIATRDALRAYMRGGARMPYELQWNTGMHRMGLGPEDMQYVRRCQVAPRSVFTHLAMSDQVKASRLQIERFKEILAVCGGAKCHVANSGGIWNRKALGLEAHTSIVRPGVSLYGVRPWFEADQGGLRPVMKLVAPVVARHNLRPGDHVGYGGAFVAKRPMSCAILGIGYGDGLMRALAAKGRVFLDGKMRPFLGTISMDLCAVACGPETRIGHMAEIFGSKIDIWDQACAAGTIAYEFMTGVSHRVHREFTRKKIP